MSTYRNESPMKIVSLSVDELISILKEIFGDKYASQAVKKQEHEYLGIDEAMEFLGISRSTMRNWMKKKKVPYSKIESKILFRKDELLSLLETRYKRNIS